MNSLLSLALIIGLTASTFPVTAQEQTATPQTAGPLARAITREAVRLATDPSLPELPQTGQQADSDWSRVRTLKPGTEIVVTVLGAQPGTRYVVLTDESDLTTLNLAAPGLPAEARRELLDAGSHHPDYFSVDRTHFVGKNVRVGPDGVFVADRKVADLGQVVERIRRSDVREIRGPERTRGSVVGAIGGAAGGFLLGGFFAVNLAFKDCGGSCSDEKALIGLSLVGLPIIGGVLGYRAFGRKTADVIYRAP